MCYYIVNKNNTDWCKAPEQEKAMKECCGNCKYNKRDFSKPQGEGYAEFCCGNEDGENYSVPTFFDDSCDDFEECDGRENEK